MFLTKQAFQINLESSGADVYWPLVKPRLQASPFELLGSVDTHYRESYAKVTWWRSQAYRFLMRWPSAYLCHLANKARHGVYGRDVARDVAAADAMQEAVEQSRVGRLNETEREALLRPRQGAGSGVAAEDLPEWRMQAEPYVPRPIVSVHVRQGDKAGEMRVFPLESYMWTAYRARRLLPGVRHIWLSTEMQSVVNATAEYKDWKFLYTDVPRQSGNTRMFLFEREFGVEQRVGDSFVNLIVASQCDLFVGVLGSNWNRMINALRLTGGRLKSTYMTLNNAEF